MGWSGGEGLVFFLRFLLTIYGGFCFFDLVARLVDWRVDLRVNLHYPGMEFPIAVVARKIAALSVRKTRGSSFGISKILQSGLAVCKDLKKHQNL